jgi:hypothetical protein
MMCDPQTGAEGQGEWRSAGRKIMGCQPDQQTPNNQKAAPGRREREPTCATVPRPPWPPAELAPAPLAFDIRRAQASRLPAAAEPARPPPAPAPPVQATLSVIVYAGLSSVPHPDRAFVPRSHAALDPSCAARAPSGSAAANFLCARVRGGRPQSRSAGAEHEPGSPIRKWPPAVAAAGGGGADQVVRFSGWAGRVAELQLTKPRSSDRPDQRATTTSLHVPVRRMYAPPVSDPVRYMYVHAWLCARLKLCTSWNGGGVHARSGVWVLGSMPRRPAAAHQSLPACTVGVPSPPATEEDSLAAGRTTGRTATAASPPDRTAGRFMNQAVCARTHDET